MYPRDADIDAALREVAKVAGDAQIAADISADPRDVDAAQTAELARAEAVRFCQEHGLVREAVSGDIVDDVPAGSIGWLLEQGHLSVATDAEIKEAAWRDLGRPEDSQ